MSQVSFYYIKRIEKYVSVSYITIVRLALLALAFLLFLNASPVTTSPNFVAYVDPQLLSQHSKELSVIVTASSAQVAAAIVESNGGEVTSRLWLIDAVAAIIPSQKLLDIVHNSAVVSIVQNQRVDASDGPVCDPEVTYEHGPCVGPRPGWVTERREKKEQLTLGEKQAAPLAQLPDGGLVAVAKQDLVTYLNADGSEREQIQNLDFENMKHAPIVGPDGSVYFMGEKPDDPNHKVIVFALNPDGSLRWQKDNKEFVLGGMAIDFDRGYVYVALKNARLHILDVGNGRRLNELKPSGDKPGLVNAAPVVGPDGIVYLQTSGIEPEKDDRKGNVFALNPDMFFGNNKHYDWRFVAEQDDVRYSLDFEPILHDNRIIIVSNDHLKIFGLNKETGAIEYIFDTIQTVLDQPMIGPSGALYISTEHHLFALNPDGTLRFDLQAEDEKFETTPVFSADGSTLYLGAGHTLYARNASDGLLLWQVAMPGKLKYRPTIHLDGTIVIGTEAEDLTILRADGRILSRLRLDDHYVRASILNHPTATLLVQAGDRDLVIIGEMPEEWDGRPDVEPAELKREWRLSNAVSIDIGADVLHETTLPNGTAVTGEGVTVALVDSGVYFNNYVKDVMGTDLGDHFLGQVDFTRGGICLEGGVQHDTYCFTKKNHSQDPYGHGSHVAGIIWSQITDYATGTTMGIAPGANLLSVHVLDEYGTGTYEDVIQGIQYVVEHKDEFNIRVMNLSLSAYPTTPYFVDPLNRAVEAAWANGITVVAAAGNAGPEAESITVPGNDPYVITVGAVDNNRTPGYWNDDILPQWSANGPTRDGFVKPDLLAPGQNIISFMYNDDHDTNKSAKLVRDHPDYSKTTSLFRMNGTSMATGITSGVAALILQAHPTLTPDEVKFRLMYSSRPAVTQDGELVYNLLQQGTGRIWAPDAVFGDLFPEEARANFGMDINDDLAHGTGWVDINNDNIVTVDELDMAELAHHYQGPIRRTVSDDGNLYFYNLFGSDGTEYGIGAVDVNEMVWIDPTSLAESGQPWSESPTWVGGRTWEAGQTWANEFAWGGGYFWGGGDAWDVGYFWGGGDAWGGGYFWGGGDAWDVGYFWGGGDADDTGYFWGGRATSTYWVNDDGSVEPPPQRPAGMHVANLDGTTNTNGSKWSASATISVVDANQNPIPGAAVEGIWSFGQERDCTTDSNGQCSVTSNEHGAIAASMLSFTVLDITHDDFIYDMVDDADLDGDSDGTTITIHRPVATAMFVVDLDGEKIVNGGKWRTNITITVHDANQQPVSNAEVFATWSYGKSKACTTNSEGICSLLSKNFRINMVNALTLEIDNVVHNESLNWGYVAANNSDPDSDSNGTSITVHVDAGEAEARVASAPTADGGTATLPIATNIVQAGNHTNYLYLPVVQQK